MSNDNVEQRAKEMGWVPQEQWKGDPEKWTDAEEYVERGEKVLPILQANNRRQREELLTRDQKIGNLQQQLDATKAIVQGLEKNFNETIERRLAEQKAQLKGQIKDAREDNDVDRELELRDQLDQLSDAEREAKAKREENKKKLEAEQPRQTSTDADTSPAFEAWKKDNPWFGEDRKKTKAVIRAAEDLRDEGETSQGVEFFNKALAIVEGTSEDTNSPPVSKVDQGNPRSNSRGGPKSYGSLPNEAKQACMEDAERFVGEDKLYKTTKEWQDYYAKTYYGE